MHGSRLALLLLAGLTCSGCFQMTTVLKVNADGSGTIENRMLFTAAALAQQRQLAALGGGKGGADPVSEQRAREIATTIGSGVTYVSSVPVTTPAGQGRDAVYAFTDVNQLTLSTTPSTPGGIAVGAQGLSTESQNIRFTLTREAGGNAILNVHVPEPNFLDALGAGAPPGRIAMIKALLAGAHVQLSVEPAGTLVRTSSAFVDGPRVTMLEVDLDEVLKDESLIARLQAAKTQDEVNAVLKGAPGLKISFEREITIEFAPSVKH